MCLTSNNIHTGIECANVDNTAPVSTGERPGNFLSLSSSLSLGEIYTSLY